MIKSFSLEPLFYFLFIYYVAAQDNLNEWNGQWFPHAPDAIDPHPVTEIHKNIYDPVHGIMMGIKDPHCDDGKSNLEIDWDFNPINYTCYIFEKHLIYRSRSDIQPVHSYDYIPKGYNAPHRCMSQPIDYDVQIPTFGIHRPLWAKYGEYTFLPRQRWVHNLEHGAVIMLYHPCADKNEVNILKTLVRKCLYRHIITPYNLLSVDRPLALVTWGHRLEMSKVAPEIVIDFIKNHALKGPEQIARDGQYSLMLERHSELVSDIQDHQICKLYDFIQ